MSQKFNWYQKRFKDKQITFTKNPPRFLYRKNSNLNNRYKHLKMKLDKEHHWYDGMVQTSNGRSKLHHQIKKAIIAYNDVLKYNSSEDKQLICDCEICQNLFDTKTIIGKKFITNHKAINATEQAESIDLKQNFEKWDYKY